MPLASIAASSSSRRGYNGNIRNERQAADACARAASSQFGRVQGIDEVFRTPNGFRVRGTVESGGYGQGYGQGYGYGERFACNVRFGQIANLRLAGGGQRGWSSFPGCTRECGWLPSTVRRCRTCRIRPPCRRDPPGGT